MCQRPTAAVFYLLFCLVISAIVLDGGILYFKVRSYINHKHSYISYGIITSIVIIIVIIVIIIVVVVNIVMLTIRFLIRFRGHRRPPHLFYFNNNIIKSSSSTAKTTTTTTNSDQLQYHVNKEIRSAVYTISN